MLRDEIRSDQIRSYHVKDIRQKQSTKNNNMQCIKILERSLTFIGRGGGGGKGKGKGGGKSNSDSKSYEIKIRIEELKYKFMNFLII